jgi:hypothetical protein
MNQFGRGEYGFLKDDNGSAMKRILSCLDEVLHNISAADEAGNEIPFEYSRLHHHRQRVQRIARSLFVLFGKQTEGYQESV